MSRAPDPSDALAQGRSIRRHATPAIDRHCEYALTSASKAVALGEV